MSGLRIRQRGRGFSLIEMMIAMVISLILMAGFAQIMVAGRQSFNTQSGMGKVQENGRFAMQFLIHDLRAAGFPKSSNGVAFDLATTTDGPAGQSDVVTMNSIGFSNVTDPDTGNAINSPYSDLDIANSRRDCLGTMLGDTNGNGLVDTEAERLNDAVAVSSRYFVADLDGDGVNSLYCDGNGDGGPAAQPLAEGVDSMQLLYGEDLDGDTFADIYQPAGAVADFANVVSVRVAILVNSVDNVAEENDTQLYALLDAPPVGPFNDLRRRRVFTGTVEIRNRTP